MTEFRPSRFEILPTVIKNLLIVNVLFFIAQNTVGATGGLFDMLDVLALHHVKSPLFRPWQLITHMFLHASFLHLFFNMFMLWTFGSVLENIWGPKRFLTFYILCGLGAALLHLTVLWYNYHSLLNDFLALKLNPSQDEIIMFYKKYGLADDPSASVLIKNYLADVDDKINLEHVVNYISNLTYRVISMPTIGASGAVFGVMAGFVYLFPNSLVVIPMPILILYPIKAKWIGAIYFGIEIYQGIQNSSGDNVAHWAHIGGGIVGFLLVITWNRTKRNTFY